MFLWTHFLNLLDLLGFCNEYFWFVSLIRLDKAAYKNNKQYKSATNGGPCFKMLMYNIKT